QGVAAGVTVSQQSGQPGQDGGRINIRGIGSMMSSTSPLVLIDDVEGNINDVDPNMIESISVLKDAASTAIFGARATNGVILVKTKRGKVGKATVSYNTYVAKQVPTNLPNVLSGVDQMILQNEASVNAGQAAVFTQAQIDDYRTKPADNMNRFNTDWQKEVFTNSAILQNHNVIISGGTDAAKFLGAATYLKQEGLIKNNNFKKYDLRLRGDVAIRKNVNFYGDINYTNASVLQPAGLAASDIIQRTLVMSPMWPGKFGDGMYGSAAQSNQYNPIGMAEHSGTDLTQTPTLQTKLGLTAELFKNFNVEASYSYKSSYTQEVVQNLPYSVYIPNPLQNSYDLASTPTQSGARQDIRYINSRDTWNYYYAQANYSFNVLTDHHIKVQGGFQGQDYHNGNMSVYRDSLQYITMPYLNDATGTPVVGGGAYEYALAGFFGRVNYDFDNKYLVELNGRYDGSSRFSQRENKQWGFFPSASAGWILSREKFFEPLKEIFTFAKIRGSYGILGNQDLGGGTNYPFSASLTPHTDYYFGNAKNMGYSLTQGANPGISWEKSTQVDAGLDVSMLKNKLSIVFDYYQKKISEMLMRVPVPAYVGTAAPFINAGSMTNKGWELSVTYKNSIGDFNYSATANLSDVKNKVNDTKGQDIVNGMYLSRAGYSINSYYLYQADGLYQTKDLNAKNQVLPYFKPTSAPGDIKYKDQDGNDTINSKDRVLMGNNFPRYEYSLNLNASWKNFDINIYLYGVGKRDNYISGVVYPFNGGNYVASGLTSALDRWTPTNTNAAYPRLYNGGNGNWENSTFWLRDGSFMRVKDITIGYNLPENLLNKLTISKFRIYFSMTNPFTFSHYEKGFDPEISNNTGYFYPIMKTYTVGLNVTF
ncbi:MAG: TonB-dependent receptor, partial [Bacteroidetes bacterium]|nr:TonB-dependent receptor [Bacteroidota bacterium]